jgi:hypothetical protein
MNRLSGMMEGARNSSTARNVSGSGEPSGAREAAFASGMMVRSLAPPA